MAFYFLQSIHYDMKTTVSAFGNKLILRVGMTMTLILLFLGGTLSQPVVETFTTPGTSNWTAPSGVTSITVECWGAGGGGGADNSTGSAGAGGGGGGAYAKVSSFPVNAGNSYSYTVGAGGSGGTNGGNGGNGGASSFNTSTCISAGGSGGSGGNNGAGGSGGTTAASTGNPEYAGGSGRQGFEVLFSYYGGGGGGSAGTGSSGSTATSQDGATAVNGGGPGGNGARNGNGSAPSSGPGGGGGGGECLNNGTGSNGGSGYTGQVRITYTIVTTPTISSFTPASACSGSGVSVVITGTFFTGTTSVKFNGVEAASFTVNSATQITATLPSAATTGPISVTTPSGTVTSSSNFTVNALPGFTATKTKAISCYGATDGEITVNVTSGQTPFKYRYSDDDGTTWLGGSSDQEGWISISGSSKIITGLGDGTYLIHVKDGNECIQTDCN